MSNHYSFGGDELHEGSLYADCPDCNPPVPGRVCEGHYDDDYALTHNEDPGGMYYCDGSCDS